MKLAVLLLEGCMHSAVAGIGDLLALSNYVLAGQGRQPKFSWRSVSADGKRVRVSGGQWCEADCKAEDAMDVDAVIVPGFLPAAGVLQATQRAAAKEWLRHLHARGRVIGASCGGVFLLAQAGLLDHRQATTTWWLQSELKQRYPRVDLARDAVVTEADRIVCAAGPMSWVDLLLRIVGMVEGPELACLCADYAVIDTAQRTQSTYVPLAHMLQRNPLLTQADMLVRCAGEGPMTVRQLASALGLSERTLNRRFMALTGEPPQAFILRRRIDVARTLLETTKRPVKLIAHAVGYQDESSFRKAFRKLTSMSPQGYRAHRGAGPARAPASASARP